MTIRTIPELQVFHSIDAAALQFDPHPKADQVFAPNIRMLVEGDGEQPAVLNIFGVIGVPSWAGGITAAEVSAQLKAIGDEDIIVNINSPGGNFFEGQAIYNMLRAHPRQVTVRVLGVAASAASVIAMAGDKIEMPKTSWIMIHECSVITFMNKTSGARMIANLQKYDDVSADLYADRTKQPRDKVVRMMTAETMMSGKEAHEKGFADKLVDQAKVKTVKQELADQTPAQQLWDVFESAMQTAGRSRQERRTAKRDFFGMLRAADPTKPSAGENAADDAAVQRLVQSAMGLWPV